MTSGRYISFFVSFSTKIWYDEYFGSYSGTTFRAEIAGKMNPSERELEDLSAIMKYTWPRDYHTYYISIGYDTLVVSSWLTVPMSRQDPIGSLVEETDKILKDLENICKHVTDVIFSATKTHLLPGTLFLGWENMSRYIRNIGDIHKLTKEIGDHLFSKSPDRMRVYSRGSLRDEMAKNSSITIK